MKFNIPEEHRKAAGIYIIRNSVDSRVYVGSTSCFSKRFSGHKKALQDKKHHSLKLQYFSNKYGISTLSFECLEVCELNKIELIDTEQKWINVFKAHIKGFNISPSAGSNLGCKHQRPRSPEHKAKISKCQTGRKKTKEQLEAMAARSRGKKASEETKRKMSLAMKGKDISHLFTKESREKLSKALKGKKQKPEVIEKRRLSLIGRTVTEATRKKISVAQKGKIIPEESKKKMSLAWSGKPKPWLQGRKLSAEHIEKRTLTYKNNGNTVWNKGLNWQTMICQNQNCQKVFQLEMWRLKTGRKYCSQECSKLFTGTNNAKIIIQYDLDGNELRSFNSLKDCVMELGLNYQSLSRAISKRQGKHKGFVFKYYDEAAHLIPQSQAA